MNDIKEIRYHKEQQIKGIEARMKNKGYVPFEYRNHLKGKAKIKKILFKKES